MAHSPVTVVLIEDDEGHARLIEKNVRRAGLGDDIHHFVDGTSALDFLFDPALREGGPILVLLDLNLPDMSGSAILGVIKADSRLKRIPVVVLTTTDDKAEMQRCYDLGCNVYVTKPVDYDAFTQALHQLGLMLSVMRVPEVAR